MEASKFKKFYDTHFQKIFRFVLLRVTDRDLAEDLVSEIFLKALKAFDGYDETRSKSSWIYTIARNHLANHFRAGGRVVSDVDIEDLPILGEDLAEKAAMNHDLGMMFQALATLPEEKRQLIRLKHLNELSYEEMAERLGRSKDALKVATFRAMQDLRAAMQQQLQRQR